MAALREGPVEGEVRLPREGGITLTSAPVSTRKQKLLARSVIKNRRLDGWPEVLVADNTRPAHFPARNTARCTSWPCPRSDGDTCRGWLKKGWGKKPVKTSEGTGGRWSGWGGWMTVVVRR